MILTLPTTDSFLLNLLEKGGLPALTIGVLFTIFFYWIRSQAKAATEERKADAEEKRVMAETFASLQREREVARTRDADQYRELMKAHEENIGRFVSLSTKTIAAITRLSERIGQCPLRDGHVTVIDDGQEGT